jgi:hypothetical protein
MTDFCLRLSADSRIISSVLLPQALGRWVRKDISNFSDCMPGIPVHSSASCVSPSSFSNAYSAPNVTLFLLPCIRHVEESAPGQVASLCTGHVTRSLRFVSRIDLGPRVSGIRKVRRQESAGSIAVIRDRFRPKQKDRSARSFCVGTEMSQGRHLII